MNAGIGWEVFYHEGAAYHARMIKGARRGALSPEVIHGLASLAIEKYLMALLVYNGTLPEGHTFFDLIRSSSRYADFSDDIEHTLDLMDKIQPLCTLDPSPMAPVSGKDIGLFMSASENVKNIVDARLPVGKA